MSAKQSAADEKRIFHRWKINSEVNIDFKGEQYVAICKDLSGAGMLMESDHGFANGDELKVYIENRDETHLPFSASAVVTRVETGENGKNIIALSIKDILD